MKRFLWVLAVGVLLQGCGFEPIYGEKHREEFGGTLPPVQIEVARERAAQILKMTLDDRLNPSGQAPSSPDYTLRISLNSAAVPVVIEGNATVRRYNVQVYAHFILTRVTDGKLVLEGNARRVGSYNASRQFFADFVASQDASERTIGELAADIEMRLHAFFLEEHKNGVITEPEKKKSKDNPLNLPTLPRYEGRN